MREWQRCRFARRCGRCGSPIAVGDPMLIISATLRAGATRPEWALARCAKCEGPAPPDLPAGGVETRTPLSRSMTGIGAVAGRFVFPVREPGEEG